MNMKAIVITIGDEILIGQIINSNASWLSSELFLQGIHVERHITVPDTESEIIKEFRNAYRKYDIIIVTGGLGPTHDDITKQCISKFFKSPLVLDKKVLRDVKSIFRRRKIPMAENNISQAMLPRISTPLTNKAGTAPGILIDKNKKIFCAMPGVPLEMKYICRHSLFPYIEKKFKNSKNKKVLLQKTIHTIGISESLLYHKIGDINNIVKKDKDSEIKLAFLPSNFEVRLRITVEASAINSARGLIRSTMKKLKDKAGRYIYSTDESPIEKAVGDILKKKGLKLSIAESCTGGLIASKITDVNGSANYFLEGMVCYTNQSKVRLLGVKRKTLKAGGAVSQQVAIEMAEGARKKSGSDIAISTTGIAGPTGATREKPVGLVWIGYSDSEKSYAKKFVFVKDRLRNKEMMSKTAIDLLRKKLLKIDITDTIGGKTTNDV